jgi:type II secretory pathway component PulC
MHRLWLLCGLACACAPAGRVRREELYVSRSVIAPGRPKAVPLQGKMAALPIQATTVVQVQRSDLKAVLAAGPQRFMSRILLDPFFIDGKFVGFQLTRFYEGDPRFASIDLRRNDVVLRVNGLPIGRPEEFMYVWDELRSADEIRIDFLRGMERRVLRVEVREARAPAAPAKP